MRSRIVSHIVRAFILTRLLIYVSQKDIVQGARAEVVAAERAFAKSMADRDINSFASWLSGEAIFFTGPEPLRGKEAVLAWWSRYFKAPKVPFSWEPDQVEVTFSGKLALSTGPVLNSEGVLIGRFNSVWRLEGEGCWRIVFDKGSSVGASEQQ